MGEDVVGQHARQLIQAAQVVVAQAEHDAQVKIPRPDQVGGRPQTITQFLGKGLAHGLALAHEELLELVQHDHQPVGGAYGIGQHVHQPATPVSVGQLVGFTPRTAALTAVAGSTNMRA